MAIRKGLLAHYFFDHKRFVGSGSQGVPVKRRWYR